MPSRLYIVVSILVMDYIDTVAVAIVNMAGAAEAYYPRRGVVVFALVAYVGSGGATLYHYPLPLPTRGGGGKSGVAEPAPLYIYPAHVSDYSTQEGVCRKTRGVRWE